MNARTVSLFIICFLATTAGGAISTLMSVYLPVVVKELRPAGEFGNVDHIGGIISAIFIAGWTCGGFVIGTLGDRIGRKSSLIISLVILGAFTILTGLSGRWEMISACRFMSGAGMGGVLVLSNTYLSEVLSEKSRSILIGILSISFPIGIFSAGVIDLFASQWREGFLIGGLPLALALIAAFLLRESQAWREKSGGKKRETVFSAQHRKSLILGSVVFGTMLIGLWGIFSWLPTWVQTLLGEKDGQTERGVSMMLLGMGGLAGGFFSGWFVNAFGAKKSMLVCFFVCTILCLILFGFNRTFHWVVYAQIGILALFFGASQGILSVFIPILFPVGIRSSATGWCFNIGRIFTAAAVLTVGTMVQFLGGYANALIIFSAIFAIGFMVLWRGQRRESGTF